jgi:hypothetical protein
MAGGGQFTSVYAREDVTGVREQLSNLISNITPADTPLSTILMKESTGDNRFEWQTDVLSTSAQNHQVSGFDITTFNVTAATVRMISYTSLSARDFSIAGDTEAAQKAGREGEIGYQMTKVAKELKRDVEVNYTANNAAVAPNGATAGESASLPAFIKTNVQAGTNGSHAGWSTSPTGARSNGTEGASSETLLKKAVRQAYEQGGQPTLVMAGPYQKQAISAFAGIAALRANVALPSNVPATIIAAADAYVSDFGTLMIVPSRHQRPIDVWVLDPDGLRERVFRDYTTEELAKTGDYRNFMILTNRGLQVDNEKAHALITDVSSA